MGLGLGGDEGKLDGGDDVFTVEYTTMGPAAPTVDGVNEAPTEESPLPARAGDAEVDDDVDDENLDADHDDNAPLLFRSMSDILATPGFASRALVVEKLHVVSSNEPTLEGCFSDEVLTDLRLRPLRRKQVHGPPASARGGGHPR